VTFLDNKSTNILISTLVIAHIKNPADTIKEWSRVLKDEADIIITDFHPDLLERGGERTFRNGKNTVKIRNYIYKISFVESLLNNEGFKSEKVIEQKVNEEVKDFYLKKNAMNVYNKFYGIPFIYGLHVRRGYAS
jgi:ubiquinone/menaquinone biosynthesis C-methylase UbiE